MTDKERIEELEKELKQFKNLYKIMKEAENQKAVEALEKVKELVNEKSIWSSPFGQQKIHANTVEQIINQLIKEYGGE